MPDTGILLALDVGDVRIGVAIAMPPIYIARPLTTILHDDTVIAQISQLIAEHDVRKLVIGLPRGLDGQETGQTAKVQSFAAALQAKLQVSYSFQDEAATSVKAEAELNSRGKQYQKADVDALAATYILEDYITEEMHV